MVSAELYIDRDLAPEAEAAQAATVLVGGYAGYLDFGDYLQLKSTLDIHERLGAHETILVALDAQARAAYRQSGVRLGANGARVLPVYCHCERMKLSEDGLDGLVRLPQVPASALVHVYGSSFNNDWWGETVRTAVSAFVERHARDNAGGRLRLFMSGLQISPSQEADTWRPLLRQAEHIGVRDSETGKLLRDALNGAAAKVFYTGDDALLALAACRANKPDAASVPTIAAHINLAHCSADSAEVRLSRVVRSLAAVARHLGAGVTCELLVACQSDRVREREAAEQFQACYARLASTGEAPPLTFRRRDIFEEAVRGTFQLGASFLVTCSYHVALSGLLSHCPTVLLAENDDYRQKAAGLAEAFPAHRFAPLGPQDSEEGVVGALLEERSNRQPGDGSYAMWMGQGEKTLRLSRLCLDMERDAARDRLELTASGFRETAAALGELRRRRIIEERLAREVAEQAPITISIPLPATAPSGLGKYTTRSYWRRRRSAWVKSVKKRVNKWS
jgi:hypothetical protein